MFWFYVYYLVQRGVPVHCIPSGRSTDGVYVREGLVEIVPRQESVVTLYIHANLVVGFSRNVVQCQVQPYVKERTQNCCNRFALFSEDPVFQIIKRYM